MPIVRIGQDAFNALVAEARNLEISVSALVTTIVLGYFEEEEEDDEEEDEEEVEDDDDVEGPDLIGELLGGDDDEDEDEDE